MLVKKIGNRVVVYMLGHYEELYVAITAHIHSVQRSNAFKRLLTLLLIYFLSCICAVTSHPVTHELIYMYFSS